MIEKLLPLSQKKLDFLKNVYENQPTHLRKIASENSIHPYQLKKIIDELVNAKIVEQMKAGRTHLLSFDPSFNELCQIFYVIEDYKQKTDSKVLSLIFKEVKAHFSGNKSILACALFGSYARGGQKSKSDVDLLFIVKDKAVETEITKRLSQLRVLLRLEFNPILMDEKEFEIALETRDPAMVTLLKPTQRIVIFGIEYFLRSTKP